MHFGSLQAVVVAANPAGKSKKPRTIAAAAGKSTGALAVAKILHLCGIKFLRSFPLRQTRIAASQTRPILLI